MKSGNNKNTGYLVVALLLVGLTAYSNAVKELTQIHQLTLGAGRLIAQWSSETVPAEIPPVAPTVIKPTVLKVETCESRRPLEPVVEPTDLPDKVERIERAVRVKPAADHIAKAEKVRRVNINADDLEVRVSTDQFPEPVEPLAFELPASALKAKARKHNIIRINSRDREMLLKTLNRSINLRIAG